MIKAGRILDAIIDSKPKSACIFIDSDTHEKLWSGYAEDCPFAVCSCELVSFTNDNYPFSAYGFRVRVDDVRRPIIERIKGK